MILAKYTTNKLWQFLSLGIVIIVCAIPGFFLAKYNVHYVDEPYQILNSLEFRNAVFSPLSAFLGHVYGNLVDWEWLKFRYLVVVINVLAVSLGAFFYLLKTNRFLPAAVIGGICTLFLTLYKNGYNLYGWDIWTVLFVIITLIILLKYLEKNSISYIWTLGVLSGVVTMLRVPSVCIIFFISIILVYNWHKDRSYNIFKYLLIFWGTSLVTILIILFSLYGSLDLYQIYYSKNHISNHSAAQLLFPYFYDIPNLVIGIFLLWGCYKFIVIKIFNCKYNRTILIIKSLFLIYVLIQFLLTKHSHLFTNVILYSIALFILIALYIVHINRDSQIIKISIISILLISCTISIGSNTGIYKIIAWPMIPLSLAYYNYRYNRKIVIGTFTVVMSLLIYSFYGIRNSSFFDTGIKQSTYQIKGKIINNLITSPEKGDRIQKIIDDFTPYSESDSNILILRNKDTDYIWEYLFLNRNEYLANKFENKEKFNDEGYVKWAEQKILNSKSINILYINDNGESQKTTLMKQMLEKNLVAKKIDPDYIIFVSKDNQ